MSEAALDLYDSLTGEIFKEFEYIDLDLVDCDGGIDYIVKGVQHAFGEKSIQRKGAALNT